MKFKLHYYFQKSEILWKFKVDLKKILVKFVTIWEGWGSKKSFSALSNKWTAPWALQYFLSIFTWNTSNCVQTLYDACHIVEFYLNSMFVQLSIANQIAYWKFFFIFSRKKKCEQWWTSTWMYLVVYLLWKILWNKIRSWLNILKTNGYIWFDGREKGFRSIQSILLIVYFLIKNYFKH